MMFCRSAGGSVAPSGASAVCLRRKIPIQIVFTAAPGSTSQTITKEISGETTFLLRSISATSSAATALLIQIQLPDGRFLLSNLADVLTFAGYGSWRWLLSEELECPPGTKITVTLVDQNTVVAQPIMLLFEGADRSYCAARGPVGNGWHPICHATGARPIKTSWRRAGWPARGRKRHRDTWMNSSRIFLRSSLNR